MSSCGDCTACCSVFVIDELQKPKNTLCSNCKGGCSIYQSRPQTCKDYKCAYLVGGWNEALRPDKCGVIIDSSKNGYQAIRFRDEVSSSIMQQIGFIEKNYNIKIKGIDSRK